MTNTDFGAKKSGDTIINIQKCRLGTGYWLKNFKIQVKYSIQGITALKVLW